jgi:hypothetical protein
MGCSHSVLPEHAPPSLVLGYGGVTEAHIRRGLRVIAEAFGEDEREIGLCSRRLIER